MIKHVLEQIKDWPERAHAANYCVNTLATRCGVSVDTLERFYAERFDSTPKDWLKDERMKRAREFLPVWTVKETAGRLGFGSSSHFSREFQKINGYSPSQHLARSAKNAEKSNQHGICGKTK